MSLCSGCLSTGCECWRFDANEPCTRCGARDYFVGANDGVRYCRCGSAWNGPKAETLPLTADDVRRIVREEIESASITITGATVAREDVQDAIAKALESYLARGCRVRGLRRCA